MKSTASVEVRQLKQHLCQGIAETNPRELRKKLGLPKKCDDRDLASALVSIIANNEIRDIELRQIENDERAPLLSEPVSQTHDTSFLGRLSIHEGELTVEHMADYKTLSAILRAGTIHQRRAALKRLVLLVSERKLSGDASKAALETITQLRSVDLAYELAHARENLPGSVGRNARADAETWRRTSETLENEIARFWDGQLNYEPIQALPGEQRAQLLLRTRDLPDVIINHLSAIIEGSDGLTTREDRIGLIASLRYAADARLIPVFLSVIHAEHGQMVVEAVRAMMNTQHPRIAESLAEEFERSHVDEERLALAGALAAHGDLRGLPYVQDLLRREDPALLADALDALETTGSLEDVEQVAQFLHHPAREVVIAAIRTLERIGDGRVLDDLSELYNHTVIPALHASIEDARLAILARMELKGEIVEDIDWSELGAKPLVLAKTRDRLSVRVRGWWHLIRGQIWLALGRIKWAVARFESAAAHRSGWTAPLISIAMAYATRGQYAHALPAFRRAAEVDRTRLERNPLYVRAMARTFLRRAEQIDDEGRADIAKGLVDEALTFDLRRAPSALRFELERLRELLRKDPNVHGS